MSDVEVRGQESLLHFEQGMTSATVTQATEEELRAIVHAAQKAKSRITLCAWEERRKFVHVHALSRLLPSQTGTCITCTGTSPTSRKPLALSILPGISTCCEHFQESRGQFVHNGLQCIQAFPKEKSFLAVQIFHSSKPAS